MQLIAKRSAKFLSSFIYTKQVSAILFINLLLIIAVVAMQNNLPPQVPLLYGKPYGAEQLTNRVSLTFPPLISMAFAIVNSVIVIIIDDDFLQKVLLVTMYTLTLLSTITIVKIILLVGDIF